MSSQADSSNSATSPEDEWASVRDPNERRKIQNRIAQRKFREKQRQQREDAERYAENEQYAGSAYTIAEPEEVIEGTDAGLPWGGLCMGHVFAVGKAKTQQQQQQQQRSMADASPYYAPQACSDGSSRYATGSVSVSSMSTPAGRPPGLPGRRA